MWMNFINQSYQGRQLLEEQGFSLCRFDFILILFSILIAQHEFWYNPDDEKPQPYTT